MDNSSILRSLESQRDNLFKKLSSSTISGLYKQEYDELKAGRVLVLDGSEREMLRELKELSKDTSLDGALNNKLNEYKNLDNGALISHFEIEAGRVLEEIYASGKQAEIQAVFTEYNYYYQYDSSIKCYGEQDYPLIEEPRYISDEFDYNKEVLFIDNGINFQPAWVNCLEFEELDHIDINYELQRLFQFHSRVMLHKALGKLEEAGKLTLFSKRPVSFYINEHDMEVMMLYLLKL